jgi:transposase InsO family protein
VKAPKANAFAERFVGTVRRECLDWMVIFGRRQLQRTLRTYVKHYNGHRPHRDLGLVLPRPALLLRLAVPEQPGQVHRRDRLGGLIHEYDVAA